MAVHAIEKELCRSSAEAFSDSGEPARPLPVGALSERPSTTADGRSRERPYGVYAPIGFGSLSRLLLLDKVEYLKPGARTLAGGRHHDLHVVCLFCIRQFAVRVLLRPWRQS